MSRLRLRKHSETRPPLLSSRDRRRAQPSPPGSPPAPDQDVAETLTWGRGDEFEGERLGDFPSSSRPSGTAACPDSCQSRSGCRIWASLTPALLQPNRCPSTRPPSSTLRAPETKPIYSSSRGMSSLVSPCAREMGAPAAIELFSSSCLHLHRAGSRPARNTSLGLCRIV